MLSRRHECVGRFGPVALAVKGQSVRIRFVSCRIPPSCLFTGPQKLEDRDRLDLPRQKDAVQFAKDQRGVVAQGNLRGMGRDENLRAVMRGRRLETLGQVHCRAHHGVVETQLGTDVSDHGDPGVESDTCPHVQDFNRQSLFEPRPTATKGGLGIDHAEGRAAGRGGVVRALQRRAEHRDDRITHILVQSSARLGDGGRALGEIFAHQRDQFGRREFLRKRSERDNIAEECGDLDFRAARLRKDVFVDNLIDYGG